MLSILCGNVYSGFKHVEFFLRSMAAQTYRDCEIILADSFYTENKTGVAELCALLGLGTVVHVPSAYGVDVGRKMHWDVYSNALLYSSGDWVMHYGVYRYMHRDGIMRVAQNAASGILTSFAQIPAPQTIDDLMSDDYGAIESRYEMEVSPRRWSTLSQCGFYSIDRDRIVNIFNGHNEALILHHWVDVDLNTRAANYGHLQTDVIDRGVLRMTKPGYSAIRVGKPVCSREVNPNCVSHRLDARQGTERIENVERVSNRGFEWVRCQQCGAVGLEDPDAYIKYLRDTSCTRAPVNVGGVGRNIQRLEDDCKKLSTSSRFELISSSYSNARYLSED